MRRSDFYYDLPPELIAQYPLDERSASRLLALDDLEAAPRDLVFTALPSLLRPKDLLVFNNTRVMRARLFGHKSTGGRVELLVERLFASNEALVHIRASKPPKTGSRIELEGGVQAEVLQREEGLFRLRLLQSAFADVMATYGHLPLPPYIRRPDEVSDEARYQTVFAREMGAVAAPTAGLHFDESLFAALKALGIGHVEVTLHVGAGTFQPVRVEDLDQHVMHAEWLEVSEAACERISEVRRSGGRVIAVGTTSVRSLETAAAGGCLQPFRGESRLFIRPGYRFRVVDAMITNFHLPESTLLMLVAAFAGYNRIMTAYRHAVAQGYRFFSYGDAMFLLPERRG
ncbi:tRNA preQ1(34) S-adenosylmethionine ribosyltransferase-isomerase QueA [Thiorhodococcus mannitoliphagus]|uniref:S-adenosylmethionine:tRNA ribosyltransferase-isomerase n=1 Tax=Thiorhodococcus mannitoliphagus TaxID=329406 RepID=A0A6P1DMY1_9GAMM|nr:tRNA preQ1(34) S-adenosylmethionine ribosyltransferase-isomerase QueA [Thiorhodococcus mannitoliphagus]NEX18900.1 tRNA preQ1(34) S-adenosylmethionine ribosyltransferase-isomerase QueA [Thiorhodococcus mannitoliphagus]